MTIHFIVLRIIYIIVEIVVAQRSVHHVTAYTVGIFDTCSPIILFGQLLATAILADQQPELSSRSRTHQHIRLVGTHTRQYHQTMRTSAVDILIRIHKVASSQNLHIIQYRNHIGIGISTIQDTDGDTRTIKAGIMQFHTIQLLNLVLTCSIEIGHGIQSIGNQVATVSRLSRTLLVLWLSLWATPLWTISNRLWSRSDIDTTRRRHEWIVGCQLLPIERVCHFHNNRVIPFTYTVNLQAIFAKLRKILLRNRQVGRINTQPLLLPALDSFL